MGLLVFTIIFHAKVGIPSCGKYTSSSFKTSLVLSFDAPVSSIARLFASSADNSRANSAVTPVSFARLTVGLFVLAIADSGLGDIVDREHDFQVYLL